MDSKLKIAVVGFGLVGQRHTDVISSHAKMDISGIVETDPTNAAKARACGFPVFEDLDRLRASSRTDGVLLATPTPVHLSQAIQCIDFGWPVLIEKPVAVTSEEGALIAQAADRKAVPVLVGHHRRYNPLIQKATSILKSGQIGAVRAIQSTCWLYKPDTYFDVAPWRKQKGAGPISVNLVHDVDLLRHFCGEVSGVRAVTTPSARGYDNEDLAMAILTFSSGAIGSISVSDSIAAPWSWELTAHENPAYPETDQSCYLIGGSEGSLSLPDLRVWKHEGAPDWWAPMSGVSNTHAERDPLVAQVEHFADVIAGRAEPLVSAAEGLKSLAVVEAITIAADTGRTIHLKDGMINL